MIQQGTDDGRVAAETDGGRGPAPMPRLAYGVGGASLALMPFIMTVANRSSPAVVGFAAFAFLVGRWREEGGLPRALLPPLGSPLGRVALAFLAWCVVSIAWSPFPNLSFRMLSEFLPTLLAAYLLARLAPGRLPGFAPGLGAIAIVFSGLYIAVDLAADLPMERALGNRVAAFVFNRPAMTLDLVAGPLALLLWRRRDRIGVAATLAFAGLGVLRSISGAAAMGLGAGLGMAMLGRVLPRRWGLGLAGLGLGLAIALAPMEGDLLARIMPDSVHAQLTQSSSRARVAIARSFGAAVAADPWRGAGYGTSGRFAETPVAAEVPAEMRVLLAVGHPHNSFLQVWTELGVLGAFLAGLALMTMLARLSGLPDADRAVALGLVACAAAIAFVEHNAWAGWWTAGLGAAITWAREAGWARESNLARDGSARKAGRARVSPVRPQPTTMDPRL